MNEQMSSRFGPLGESLDGAATFRLRPAGPVWLLRFQLRWTEHAIARLEHELEGEFATLETEPLHRELAGLWQERDRLRRRLMALH